MPESPWPPQDTDLQPQSGVCVLLRAWRPFLICCPRGCRSSRQCDLNILCKMQSCQVGPPESSSKCKILKSLPVQHTAKRPPPDWEAALLFSKRLFSLERVQLGHALLLFLLARRFFLQIGLGLLLLGCLGR